MATHLRSQEAEEAERAVVSRAFEKAFSAQAPGSELLCVRERPCVHVRDAVSALALGSVASEIAALVPASWIWPRKQCIVVLFQPIRRFALLRKKE